MFRSLLCVLACLPIVSLSQLQLRQGDILEYTDSLLTAMPSGTSTNTYQIPSQVYRDAWKTLFGNFLQRNDSLAASQAQALSYRLIAFVDTSAGSWPYGQEYRVLEKLPMSSNYWGTYVLAVHPARPQLVIQAPHPLNDSRTGLQSAYVFRAVAARAFFLSGTHRCNSSTYSPCDGTTSTCGTNEPFRESDPAHSITHPFFVGTGAAEEIEQPYVIQLHGFAKQVTDPHLIMSNSTALTPSVDLLSHIRDALLVADNTLTFRIAHLDSGWTRLTGTTNVEGRLINGSANPCDQASPANAGRFFHIDDDYILPPQRRRHRARHCESLRTGGHDVDSRQGIVGGLSCSLEGKRCGGDLLCASTGGRPGHWPNPDATCTEARTDEIRSAVIGMPVGPQGGPAG